jgi:hypothetical protein
MGGVPPGAPTPELPVMDAPLPYVAMRRLPFGALLETAGRLYVRTIGWMVLAVLLVVIPGFAILIVAGHALTSAYHIGPSSFGARILEVTVTLGLIEVVVLAVFQLANSVCLKIAADALFGERPSLFGALRYSVARWPSVLGVTFLLIVPSIVASAIEFAASFKLGALASVVSLVVSIPLIWYGNAALFAVPSALFERLSPANAIGRSMNLIQGSWWRCYGTFMLLAGFFTLWFLVLDRAFGSTVTVGDTVTRVLTSGVVTAFGLPLVLLVPLISIVTLLLYVDLRVAADRTPSADLLAIAMGSTPSGGGLVFALSEDGDGGLAPGGGLPPMPGGFSPQPTPGPAGPGLGGPAFGGPGPGVAPPAVPGGAPDAGHQGPEAPLPPFFGPRP